MLSHHRPQSDLRLAKLPSTDLHLLSETERSQLGTPLRDSRYATAEEWLELRAELVSRDKRRRPLLDTELTAYTPGETLKLFEHPLVKKWHEEITSFRVPRDTELVVFVPCAATKPWAEANRGIYQSFNAIRKDVREGLLPKAYFVTISEPLGVVPEARWADFPQYENPGLFKDPAQRAGMYKSDWIARCGERLHLPFDKAAYDECISTLGAVIAKFCANNPGFRYVSFVEGPRRERQGTHSEMIDAALEIEKFMDDSDRYAKRAKPRDPPYPYMRKILSGLRET